MIRNTLCAAALAVALPACVSTPEPWGPTPLDGPPPRAVMLVDDSLPDRITAYRVGSMAPGVMDAVPYPYAGTATGAAGGLLGALIVAGVEAGIDARRNDLLGETYAGVDGLEDRLAARIRDGLADKGVAVSGSVPRGGEPDDRALATAFAEGVSLDVFGHNVGFVADGGYGTWRAYGQFTVRLVEGGASPRILLEDRIVYNESAGLLSAVSVQPDAEGFEDFDAIIADPEGAAAAMDAMVDAVADAVVVLLTETGRPPAPAPAAPFEELNPMPEADAPAGMES